MLRGSAIGVGAAVVAASAVTAVSTGSPALAAPVEAAAVTVTGRYFLTLTGIAGESLERNHRGALDLVDIAWSLTHPAASTGGGSGRPVFSALHVTALTSSASPALFLACASGRTIQQAQLDIVRAGANPLTVVRIRLGRVLVTGFETRDTAEAQLVDEIALGFSTIEFSYTPTRSDGTAGPAVVAGWDVVNNRPV